MYLAEDTPRIERVLSTSYQMPYCTMQQPTSTVVAKDDRQRSYERKLLPLSKNVKRQDERTSVFFLSADFSILWINT